MAAAMLLISRSAGVLANHRFVKATNTTPSYAKPKANEKILRKRRRLVLLGVSDRLTPSGSSVDIRIFQQFAASADRRPRFVDGLALLRSAHAEAVHYFLGSALDRSDVSLSGVEPAGTPFFCNRNAMTSVEFLAETEPGADMGISVCTSDHRVETFLPP